MATTPPPEHDADLVDLVLIADANLRVYQLSPGSALLCRHCHSTLTPVACAETGNIDAYECRCKPIMISMDVYQDIARFNRALANLQSEHLELDRNEK